MEDLGVKLASVTPSFWQGKHVFLTGHTGFKGSWLALWLSSMGARVTGYALAPNTQPNLFEILSIENQIYESHIADIRDLDKLQQAIKKAQPDILIHMAAQPLVRYSYENPVETYATNVMGTVHVLEAIRHIDTIRAAVVVTTDKCYENKEWVWGYREDEPMGGYDPYSSSKGCAELVTAAYRRSFFSDLAVPHHVSLASARAGNVIGGGDWSKDRLIPDAIKAFDESKPLMIRNPLATRPWQHVLEPLSGYLILAEALYENGIKFESSWNFGPRSEDERSVQEVIDLLIEQWGGSASWQKEPGTQPHEAHLLKLDCSKAYQYLGWTPKWSVEVAIQKIMDWHKSFQNKDDMQALSLLQIQQYMNS